MDELKVLLVIVTWCCQWIALNAVTFGFIARLLPCCFDFIARLLPCWVDCCVSVLSCSVCEHLGSEGLGHVAVLGQVWYYPLWVIFLNLQVALPLVLFAAFIILLQVLKIWRI
jgi:hypothetical protein